MPEKNYEPPRASLGPALWRQQPGSEPFAAIITRVMGRSVCMTIFPHEGAAILKRDVVRHSSDPDLRRLPSHDGCWDYTEPHEVLNVLVS